MISQGLPLKLTTIKLPIISGMLNKMTRHIRNSVYEVWWSIRTAKATKLRTNEHNISLFRADQYYNNQVIKPYIINQYTA